MSEENETLVNESASPEEENSEVKKWALTREERLKFAVDILSFVDLSGQRENLSADGRKRRAEDYLYWLNDIARSSGIKKDEKDEK